MSTAVNSQSAEVARMATDWPVIEALLSGTPAMRAAGERLMPKFTMEDPEDYKCRLASATLFPALRRTVSVMAGKPFSKQLTLSDDTPPEIVAWSDDIDREGVSLHVFAAEMMAEALGFGICGILVEAPKPIDTGKPVVTRQDEKDNGIRPYFVRVRHNQILGWRVERINGETVLSQLRLAEAATVNDGDFGQKVVQRVRVLEPGRWAVWEKTSGVDGKDAWVIVEEGASGLTKIPYVPLYGSRIWFLIGVSPLLDLAYLNVKHWQTQSDQDDSTRFARKRLLVLIGGETDKPVVASSSYAVTLPVGGDVKIVQGSAESVKVGRDELSALEDQMIQAGAELLVKKPGARSATESANDAEANKSDLQRITEGFEDSLDQALQFMADYAKLGSGGNVSLFKDFGANSLGEASGQLILSARDGDLISDATAISELKRRGELSAEVTATTEAEAIKAQPPKVKASVVAAPIATA